MKTIPKLFIACALLTLTGSAAAQTNSGDAPGKLKQAIALEDAGKVDDAIPLLEEAIKLAPGEFAYPYELAYAYSMNKDYKKAIETVEPVLKYKDASGQGYQLMGNCYDEIGQSDKALKIYAEGLKKYPTAGYLYLEPGVVLMKLKKYDEALASFEKGIQVSPAYPSNYYWAAKLFLGSGEKVWGMIYGEIFMNLERNSKRTAEISKLLFDTYKSQIQFTSDTSMTVSFSKSSTIDISSLTDLSKFKMPFGVGVYEPCILMAVTTQKRITLNSIDSIRQSFLDFYFKKFIKDYPIVLYYYQNEIETSGNFEAYNHWLLLKGDEDAFNVWKDANKQKWDDFIKWYSANPIQINDGNKFYRAQYR